MAEFRHIVRLANTDLKGEKPVLYAMKKIKGIDTAFANAVLTIAGVDKHKKAGNLIDAEVKKLQDIIEEPFKYDIPSWIVNRRKDYETGEDKHVFGPNLRLTLEDDIKRMKKIKSYKGLRHQWGLTVRGQKTRSNFRNKRNKTSGKKR